MDQLLSHPEISVFLQGYPQQHWLAVLKATLLYGISSLKALKAAGLPVDVLELTQKEEPARPGVANIKGKLQDMKTQIEEIDKFLAEAPGFQAQQQAPPTRSCSVPKAKSDQHLDPVYPDWWPKDTTVSKPPPTKPQSKAKPPKTRPRAQPEVPAAVSQLKPAMKTTGTSTALVQPPFRMNYVPRQTTKPLKTVAFRANQPEMEERPEEQANMRPLSASPLSSSTRDQRPKWSQPDAERETVKRQWMGDFSDVVKRSPLKSSSGTSEPLDVARKYETSSASSISTYHPSEELKAFYRNEHDKIFAEPRPKTLAPRELSLDPAAQVSMSAQLYRMSGSSGESEEEQLDSFSRS